MALLGGRERAAAAVGLLLVLAGVAGAATLPGQVVLHAPELFGAAGKLSVGIASADLDDDGNADLVVMNRKTKNVSVLLGDGAGRFAPAVPHQAGNSPYGLDVGDLDGDGAVDVAVANNGPDTVSLLFGTGNGGLGNPQPFAVGNGPTAVVIADFKEDLKPDLAVTNGTDGTVSLLLGQGNRQFAPGSTTPVGSAPWSAATADLDEDGNLDLVVANRGGSDISLLYGNGNGGFPTVQSIAGVGLEPTAVATADLNEDGWLDLVVAIHGSNKTHDADTVRVLLGQGNRAFTSVPLYGKTAAHPQGLAIGDLDRDGNLDVIVGSGDSATAAILYGDGQWTGPLPRKIKLIAAGRAPIDVVAAYLDGDSRLDLAFADSFLDGLAVALGDGADGVRQAATTDVGSNPVAAAVADVNGDGDLDALIANSNSGTVSVLLGLGDGRSFNRLKPDVQVGLTPNDVVTDDFDGDNKPDLAVANMDSNTVSVLRGNGNGTFTRTDIAVGTKPHGLAVGDLNLDGDPDLVSANAGSANLSVLTNDGNGNFSATTKNVPGSRPVAVAIGDVTNDGLPDVATADYDNNRVAVLPGLGGGSLGSPTFYNVGARPTSVAAGNINVTVDSIPDLVVTNRRDSTVSVLLADGSGGVQPALTFPAGVGYKTVAVAIADLNGDGKPDLAVANSGGPQDFSYCHARGGASGGVSVLRGSGNGQFTPAGSYASRNDACDVAVGDLNGDGRLDVTVPAARARVAQMYLNETP